MKAKPTPEVDQLMWLIAESGDTRAVEEFETRHPDQKYELARRIGMLRGLKTEGKRVHREVAQPVFRPQSPKPAPVSPRMAFAIGALCVAALAAATYTVSTFMQPAPTVRAAPSGTQVASTTGVIEQNVPRSTQELPPVVVPTPPAPAPSTLPVASYLQPQSIRIEQAPLTTALEMIAAQGKVRITIGPGMPNPDIHVEMQGKNTVQMLQTLGSMYGFTPFDQGDGSILVIPAVSDADRGRTPASASEHQETSDQLPEVKSDSANP